MRFHGKPRQNRARSNLPCPPPKPPCARNNPVAKTPAAAAMSHRVGRRLLILAAGLMFAAFAPWEHRKSVIAIGGGFEPAMPDHFTAVDISVAVNV